MQLASSGHIEKRVRAKDFSYSSHVLRARPETAFEGIFAKLTGLDSRWSKMNDKFFENINRLLDSTTWDFILIYRKVLSHGVEKWGR